MHTAMRASIPALAAAAVLSVTGCGSTGPAGPASSPPSATPANLGAPPAAGALLASAAAAVHSATSMHMAGYLMQGRSRGSMDLTLTRSGDLYGSIGLGGGTVTVLATGKETLMKISSAFLRVEHIPRAACLLMCGRWFKMPVMQARDLMHNVSWGQLFNALKQTPAGLKANGSATVNGIACWVLGSRSDGTLYIAAHGTPYPVRIVGPHHQGLFDFTQWDTATIPPAPPASDVVDLGQLSKLG